MEPWLIWTLIGFAVVGMFSGKEGCSGRRSKRPRTSASSDEIAQLKSDLDASHQQIGALKARLEAVETILTDEELQLRREFEQLRHA